MFTVLEPSQGRIEEFLAAQQELPFSYAEVGASQSTSPPSPPGYTISLHRIQLGVGARCFASARAALQSWAMYGLGWTRLYPAEAPVEAGQVVCVVVSHGFCWSLNSCRIIYLVQEQGEIESFGFALGTLPGHAEAGEERFAIEWRRADDSVWFEIFSFARPQHVLARLGFPLVRLFQRRFAADAQRAMLGFNADQ